MDALEMKVRQAARDYFDAKTEYEVFSYNNSPSDMNSKRKQSEELCVARVKLKKAEMILSQAEQNYVKGD